jgi:biotin transport system substrate-specific component
MSRNLVYSGLFTALIIAGTWIRIPVGPVPVVLASLFVLLAALIQKLPWALASVALYLALGAVGLPVFSGGGGIGYFAGPTGGYLVGYLFAVVAAHLFSSATSTSTRRDIVAVTAATIVIYLPGVSWLKASLGLSWTEALSTGLLPFLIGDALKAFIALSAFVALKRIYPELIPRAAKPATAPDAEKR